MTVPGGGEALAGLPWRPPHAGALPGSTNLVGTNAQAHLLVMSLMIRISDTQMHSNTKQKTKKATHRLGLNG